MCSIFICADSVKSPLNLIGMPFYRETLFSAWPKHLLAEVGAQPAKIDPDIIASTKRSDFAPWPRKTRRYQFEDTRAFQRIQDTLAAPKFLSERARVDEEGERRISDALEVLASLAVDNVPVIYKNVEIKYSKFGVDDFDFE